MGRSTKAPAARPVGGLRAGAALALALLLALAPFGQIGCRKPPAMVEEVVTPTPSPTPSPTPRKPRPRRSPTPTPLPSGSPEATPEISVGAPSPSPGESVVPATSQALEVTPSGPMPSRDTTSEPFTQGISEGTSSQTARALETSERARIELQSGTTARAIELSDDAIRLSPRTIPAYVVRARAHLAEGETDLARADLDQAAKQSPDRAWLAEIVAVTGATYEADGKKEEALAAYSRAVLIFPGNKTARAGLRRLAGP